jgi:hypothetical protein
LVELKTEEVRRVSVVAGQFSVAANDLRYVSRIDIEDSAGKITPLKRNDAWLAS